ncbi:MAG: hypothetical protein V4450_15035 [Bacteroidota bacterium]
MSEQLMDTYRQRAEGFRSEKESLTRTLYYNSILRLICFIFFGWFLYTSFQKRFQGLEIGYAVLGLIAFLLFVIRASAIRKKTELLAQLININENEINLLNGKDSFLDDGSFFKTEKGFTADLTVFGKRSLFHTLNRAGSVSGKRSLSRQLANPSLDPATIQHYQSCIKELAGKITFRQSLLAHTLLLKEEEALAQLQSPLLQEHFSFVQKAPWLQLSRVWPIAGGFVIGYSVYKNSFSYVLALTLLGLLVLSPVFKKISQLYNHISKRGYLFTQYATCFQLIRNETMEHPYLLQKQQTIADAEEAFRKLARLMGVFDLRLSMLSFFINGLFLSDLLCAQAYLRWNKQYQPFIQSWFDTMGEIEALNSLATFHSNHPGFVFPEITEESLLIKATALGHPLMRENAAIVNDASIGSPAALHIITGSNMSGKSTFLRTVGLNIILAQTGAPVFAKKFLFKPVRLLTSFHHIDSLEESTSYFYAELKCLQEIIHSLNDPQPALVLLDEVMRGTNSKDKHDGTALLIRNLLDKHCLALIATHDTELGILSATHPAGIENHCFESEISANGLTFDFKMRDGVAQSKNATYLMRQMGIV